MGECADDALDRMLDIDELQVNGEYEYDDGEYSVFSPAARYAPRPVGPGPCPRCGNETRLRRGIHEKFYGCTQFPTCKGSRNYIATDDDWETWADARLET